MSVNSLVCAAQAMPLTQSNVGLVHWLDVGFCCHNNAVTDVSAAHPSTAKKEKWDCTLEARALKAVLLLDEKCLSERYLGPKWFQPCSESLKRSRLEPCAFHLSPKVGMRPNCSWMICLISPERVRVESCSLTPLTPLDLFVWLSVYFGLCAKLKVKMWT